MIYKTNHVNDFYTKRLNKYNYRHSMPLVISTLHNEH